MSEQLATFLTGLAIIAGFIFLIVVHEFGHYIVAKISNIKVTDFFVGFGPKLWTFKKGETTYGIAAIPLGGYVKMAGSDVLDDEDKSIDDERGLAKASLTKKIFIIMAGSTMNIVVAFILLSIVSGFYGITVPTTKVAGTTKGLPAEKALLKGDKIIRINDKKIRDWKTLSSEIKRHREKKIAIEIVRKKQNISLTLKTVIKDNEAIIGIWPQQKKVRNLTFAESIKSGANAVYFFGSTVTILIYKGITGQSSEIVKGSTSIIGAVAIGATTTETVLEYLGFIGMISLALAYINLVPLPPLDGGRAAIYVFEKVIGRPLKKNAIIGIMAFGLALVLLLMIYLVGKDIFIIATNRSFY